MHKARHRFQYKLADCTASVISNIMLSFTESIVNKERNKSELKRELDKFILKKNLAAKTDRPYMGYISVIV